MPGPLKNARHERFAQELAKGASQAEAYARAGYKPSEQIRARCATLAGFVREAWHVLEPKQPTSTTGISTRSAPTSRR
jgi:hypothetical protein